MRVAFTRRDGSNDCGARVIVAGADKGEGLLDIKSDPPLEEIVRFGGAAAPGALDRKKDMIVLKPGAAAAEDELIRFCREHLAAYEVPRVVQLVGRLPKTSTGKIMRRELSKLDA